MHHDFDWQDFFASVIGGGRGGSDAASPSRPPRPLSALWLRQPHTSRWNTSSPTLRLPPLSFAKLLSADLNRFTFAEFGGG